MCCTEGGRFYEKTRDKKEEKPKIKEEVGFDDGNRACACSGCMGNNGVFK